MADPVQCPDCSAWNPPKATRCKDCGRELRGADVRFAGPPPGAEKVRTPEQEREDAQRRAAEIAASVRATRAAKREVQRKRNEYATRKARLEREVASERKSASDEHPSRVAHPTVHDATPEPRSSEPAPDTDDVPPREVEANREGRRTPTRGPRIATHVRGLDDALDGGIPRGFVVVLEGSPGTMKSSLGFWIAAHNCAADGTRALYLSFEEGTASLLRQMQAIGVDTAATGDRLKVIDPPLLQRAFGASRKGDWLDALKGLVPEGKGKPDLLVLDSLDALEVTAKLEDRRRELFRLFEWLRDLGATTFVIAERPDYVVQGNVFMGRYDEDFLADGVVNLRLHLVGDQDAQRRLRIVKMRATRHETGFLALHVGDGEIEVGRVLSG